MVIHMIAFLGIGAAVFAFVYAIRHLSGWRLGLFAFVIGVLVAGMKNPRTGS